MGLRAANQQFARAIRAVRAGREVVITDRGRPLAVIRRVEDVEDDDDARLGVLAQEGLVTLGTRRTSMPALRGRLDVVAGESIAAAVDRDRDETA